MIAQEEISKITTEVAEGGYEVVRPITLQAIYEEKPCLSDFLELCHAFKGTAFDTNINLGLLRVTAESLGHTGENQGMNWLEEAGFIKRIKPKPRYFVALESNKEIGRESIGIMIQDENNRNVTCGFIGRITPDGELVLAPGLSKHLGIKTDSLGQIRIKRKLHDNEHEGPLLPH